MGAARLSLVTALLALGAMGCSSPPSEVESSPEYEDYQPPAEQEEPPVVAVADSLDAAMAGTFRDSFGLLTTRDIVVQVRLPAESGVRFVKLDISRDGTNYSTKWRAVTTDTAMGDLAEHPTLGATRVIRPILRDGEQLIFPSLPVAGTQITRYRLSGQYRIAVSTGAEADQLIGETAFRITAGGGPL